MIKSGDEPVTVTVAMACFEPPRDAEVAPFELPERLPETLCSPSRRFFYIHSLSESIHYATVLAMPFEEFKRNSMPSTQTPTITIQKRGALSLNVAAFEALGSPSHVVLLYDRESECIGIRKAAAATPHAYAVRGVGNNQATHVVSGKAFLSYYDIPRDVARRWPATKRANMLVVDLRQPPMEVTGHSSRAHEGGG
jgi:hypothetical protein